MKVLITRPQPQGEALARRLAAAGLKSIVLPAFDFEATGETVTPGVEWSGAGSRLLVFTSPRAVEHGMRALPSGILGGARVASVGPATSRALASWGLEPLQASGPVFDSEALLERIDRGLDPGVAVILTAPGGRDALRRGLETLGWKVEVVPVYRRVFLDPPAAAVAALQGAERLVSVWTSGAALEHLMSSLSASVRARIQNGPAVVVSERLAALARARGIADVIVSDAPDNEALAACCRRIAA